MPRTEIRPFYRKFTRSYYVQIGRKQINLGREKRAAEKKCRELLQSTQAFNSATTTVVGLIAKYLDWCSKHRAEATYYASQFYLKSFAATISNRLAIQDIKPQHLHSWIETVDTWSSTSRHDAITIVQRVFSWAVNQQILDYHPLSRIEGKPRRERREIYYTPKQWQNVMSHVRDQNFRDLLNFLSETGCRPFEARIVEAHHCELQSDLVVLHTSESKGKKSRRTIILTDKAAEICSRLCREHPSGPIFRNTRGRPWTKDSICSRFQRLKGKVGISNLCAYGIRHTYATDGLLNGVDSVVLAELMGHKDHTMVAKTYQHVAKNLSFLRAAAKQAKRQDASISDP